MKTKKIGRDTAAEAYDKEFLDAVDRLEKEEQAAREKAWALMKQKVEEAKLVASSITGVPVAAMAPFLMVGECDDAAVFTIVDKTDGTAFLAKVCGDDVYVTLYIFGTLQKGDEYLTAIWTPEWDLGNPQEAINNYAWVNERGAS